MRCSEAYLHGVGRRLERLAGLRAFAWAVLAITAPILVFTPFGCGRRTSSLGPGDDAGGPGTIDTGADAGAADLPPSVGCAKQLASGDDHACILYADGRAACIGGGGFGQLGSGSTADAPAPVRVEGLAP